MPVRIKQLNPIDLAEGEVIGRRNGLVQSLGQLQPTNAATSARVFSGFASTYTNNTTTYSSVTGASGTFTAPVTGNYLFFLEVQAFSSAGEGAFQVNITGATTRTVGYDSTQIENWWDPLDPANNTAKMTFLAIVPLNAGVNSIQLQAKLFNPGTLTMSNLVQVLHVFNLGGTATVFASLPINTAPSSNADIGPTVGASPGAAIANITAGTLVIPATGFYEIEMDAIFTSVSGTYVGVGFSVLIGATSVVFPGLTYNQLSAATNRSRFSGKQIVSLVAGTYSVTPRWWVADNGGSTARIDPNMVVSVMVRGGAAVQSSLDTRGDSITYDAAIIPAVLTADTRTYLAGYAGQSGTLRSLAVGMDGTTVTAGTVVCDLLVNGVVKATATLSTSNATFAVDDTSTPVVAKGDKIEIKFTVSSTYQNAAAAAKGIQTVASFSTSTAVIKAWHQASFAGTVGSPSSTTWAGVAALITLADEQTSPTEVTRATDTLTFVKGGLFQLDFSMEYSVSVGGLAARARKTNGTAATLLQRMSWSPITGGTGAVHLRGLIQVSAGDTVQIQYARTSGTPSTFGPVTFDTETGVVARLSAVRIG